MRVLLTGAAGQVGRETARAMGADDDLLALDRAALDITDREAVFEAVRQHRPEVVINAAAYTAVDHAESEAETVLAVNRDGTRHLAEACAEAGAALIHLSTDYVFDGQKAEPYSEGDPPNPLGAYGQSKWEGEEAVRQTLRRHVILRTSWVFSAHPPNFVLTMLRLARERDALRVVADQQGCPTAAADVARSALAVARRLVADAEAPMGTFHLAGQPATTWHGFAEAVVEEARRHGPLRAQRVEPIATAEYPTPAPRPANSRLDTAKLERAYGLAAPDWRPALRRVIKETVGA